MGESFVCYDSGEPHVIVSQVRQVTPIGNVIVSNAYQAAGADALTEQERYRLEMVQRMIVTNLNRSRQSRIVEQLKYWDEDGYTNLRYYFKQISDMKEAGRLKRKTAARINIKHFSLVNQQVGRSAGDMVLRRYISTVVTAMGPGALISRLGGDNFVLLFDTDKLAEVMRVLSGMSVKYDDDQRIEVSAVAGMYTISESDNVPHPGYIMERIITAYLAAKRENTNDVVFYTKKLEEERQRSLLVQKRYKIGISNEEFKVYYQPKVDIETKTVVGAEALCRWISDGELIPPAYFIPELERGLDICQLDFYMLDHVCWNIRGWLDEGMPVVPISVNISRRNLFSPDLFTHIMSIIDKYSIPHRLIEIELTETTTDVEFKDLKRLVGQLQRAGVATSVDDFGVGYSSLNLIKQIPWNVLKLDKSILPDDENDMEREIRLFGYIVSAAHEMGLKCIAEGVETEAQLDIMKQCGCRYVQGYVFDRPMPVSEFEKRLMIGNY